MVSPAVPGVPEMPTSPPDFKQIGSQSTVQMDRPRRSAGAAGHHLLDRGGHWSEPQKVQTTVILPSRWLTAPHARLNGTC